MKISDILKEKNVYSKEIKIRFSQGNIMLNGEVIKEDIELGEITYNESVGQFVYELLKENKYNFEQLKFFKLDGLIGSNIDNNLTKHLNNFNFLRYSKNDTIVLNKNILIQ